MDLLKDPWIPATGVLLSIQEAMESDLAFDCNPMLRLAILRLLICVKAWDKPLDAQAFALDTFLQTKGVPRDSARHPWLVVTMTDGGNIALNPKVPAITSALQAQALMMAYFCDRPGFKARIPGLSISGKCPLHVGKRVAFNRGASIRALVENNAIESPPSQYAPPWVEGWALPTCDTPSCMMELFLWPWRRVQVFPEGVAIAPGVPVAETTVDPWVVDKARLAHQKEPPGEKEVTALVLNQALPIACWSS